MEWGRLHWWLGGGVFMGSDCERMTRLMRSVGAAR